MRLDTEELRKERIFPEEMKQDPGHLSKHER